MFVISKENLLGIQTDLGKRQKSYCNFKKPTVANPAKKSKHDV
jgi:hypothetical protein